MGSNSRANAGSTPAQTYNLIWYYCLRTAAHRKKTNPRRKATLLRQTDSRPVGRRIPRSAAAPEGSDAARHERFRRAETCAQSRRRCRLSGEVCDNSPERVYIFDIGGN